MKKIRIVTHKEGEAHPSTWTVMKGLVKQGKSVTMLTLVLMRVSTGTKMGKMIMSKFAKGLLQERKREESGR